MVLLQSLVYFIIGTSILIYIFLHKRYSYWAKRGILHDKPKYIFGNAYEVGRSKSFHEITNDYYKKYKGKEKFVGIYMYIRHIAMVLDLDIVKNVLVKDFEYFSNRGIYVNEKDDPLSANLLFLDGEQWKHMRAKLTPIFTSGKMKLFFQTTVNVANQLVQTISDLNHSSDAEPMELKELATRYASDIVANVIYGLDCNSLKYPETRFNVISKLTAYGQKSLIMNSLKMAFPNLARSLGLKIIHKDVSEFFTDIVQKTLEYRERTGLQRNDFLNLLIELRKADSNAMTLNQINAQAFLFFAAGFETTANTIAFCLYELALNQKIQNKVRSEIKDVLSRHDNKFTYEAMNEMTYLEQVLKETLRKYALSPFLLRKTVKDYTIPNTKHIIEQGTIMMIPTHAIQHDPDIYPNPEVFDPSRFSPTALANRHSMTWFGFGAGPRNCIGLRFGKMEVIVCLVMVIKAFRILPTKETQIPLKYDVSKFFANAEKGILLKAEKL